MFRQSDRTRQTDLFESFESHLPSVHQQTLHDSRHWHNVFFEEVLSRIDEERFGVLYSSSGEVRPNAPVRLLLGMMILKEGFVWSDRQLFDQCRFNVLVMRALGLTDFSDGVPAPSTYYLFRQRLGDYQQATGEDLVGSVFAEVTRNQALSHGVTGSEVRMGSKLFGSNLARCNRLQLLLGVLQKFWKHLAPSQQLQVKRWIAQQLNEWGQKSPQKWVFDWSDEHKQEHLITCGQILKYFSQRDDFHKTEGFAMLERLLNEHFEVKGKKVHLKPPKSLSARTLQSPHDQEATYRTKREDSVVCYSLNVTETCHEEGLNLLLDVQVEPASMADTDWFAPSLQRSEAVAGPIEQCWQDGAYQSAANQQWAEDYGIDAHITGTQGKATRFQLFEDEHGIQVFDTQTETVERASLHPHGGRQIPHPDGDQTIYRFTQETLNQQYRRFAIENMPQSLKHRRNNVEASIF